MPRGPAGPLRPRGPWGPCGGALPPGALPSAALEPSAAGVVIEVEGGIGRPPLEPTPRNRALWRMAESLGREIGLELTEGRAGGGSDGNTTSRYTATLDGLGPVGDGAHAHHEFLDLDRTIERAALLALLLLAPPLEEIGDG